MGDLNIQKPIKYITFFFIQSDYLENITKTTFCVISAFDNTNILMYKKIYTRRAPYVADIVVSMLSTFKDQVFDEYENVTLIGFSSGAHLSGMIGRALFGLTGEQVGVIFGNLSDMSKIFENNKIND